MNLQQAALEKRSKELEAKEAYIDEKLKVLDNAPINLRVYEAQVTAKEKQLKDLQTDIETAMQSLAQLELDKVQKIRKLENRIKELTNTWNDISKAVADKRIHQDKLVEILANLEQEIKDRKVYQEEQEAAIEESANSGNEALLDIQDKLGKRQQDLIDKQSEVLEAQETLDNLLLAIEDQTQAQSAENALQTERAKTLQEQIDKLQTKLKDESQAYNKIVTDADSKLAILKEKEESLVAKHDAIKLEQEQLDRDRRQWQATRNLYGA